MFRRHCDTILKAKWINENGVTMTSAINFNFRLLMFQEIIIIDIFLIFLFPHFNF